MAKPSLLIVTGPTASGKTQVAVELAKQLGGEVLSADSMQIYQGLDILSAKPTEEEMRGVRHHLLSALNPSEKCSAAAYRQLADRAIGAMVYRRVMPIVCGGTGLYIDALTRPLGFSVEGDDEYRAILEELGQLPDGKSRLHRELERVDPDSAARLHVNDVRRVIRALEVFKLTGRTLTEHIREDGEKEGRYDAEIFALEWTREALNERIDRRVDEMLARGLVKEVERLLEGGLTGQETAMQAIGLKEIAMALEGKIPMEEAAQRVKQASRQYAKRQMTWFRRDARICWVKAEGRSTKNIAREILWKRTEQRAQGKDEAWEL